MQWKCFTYTDYANNLVKMVFDEMVLDPGPFTADLLRTSPTKSLQYTWTTLSGGCSGSTRPVSVEGGCPESSVLFSGLREFRPYSLHNTGTVWRHMLSDQETPGTRMHYLHIMDEININSWVWFMLFNCVHHRFSKFLVPQTFINMKLQYCLIVMKEQVSEPPLQINATGLYPFSFFFVCSNQMWCGSGVGSSNVVV